MSTATQHKQNATDITDRLGQRLGLPDTNRLTLALVQVAAQEAERNRSFASRVQATYEALPATRTRTKMVTAFDVKLTPIKQVPGAEFNPAAPLDPYFLLEVYGAGQLPTALSIFPVNKLKEAASMVERRNPGTKPTNRSQRAALTDYIVKHVAD